jgi:hypothetical protein
VGRRSRKRTPDDAAGARAPGGSSRAERDAARARRARALAGAGRSAEPPRPAGRRSISERPRPPWGRFPLTELVALAAILLGIGWFFVEGPQGAVMLIASLTLGSLVGLELSLREHLAGYRSHSTLLAGVAGAVAMVGAGYGLGFAALPAAAVLALGLLAGVAAFMPTFVLLRRAFRRRSGGLSFRY